MKLSKQKFHNISLLLLLLIANDAMAEQLSLQASDIRIEDGDTLLVEHVGQPYKIQLVGIDAPEDSENPKLTVDLKRTGLTREQLLQLGMAASTQLRQLITNNAPFTLHFDPLERDRYGRIPGDLIDQNDRSVAQMMVQLGYAIALVNGSHTKISTTLPIVQQQAINKRSGLWGEFPNLSRRWAGIGNE